MKHTVQSIQTNTLNLKIMQLVVSPQVVDQYHSSRARTQETVYLL